MPIPCRTRRAQVVLIGQVHLCWVPWQPGDEGSGAGEVPVHVGWGKGEEGGGAVFTLHHEDPISVGAHPAITCHFDPYRTAVLLGGICVLGMWLGTLCVSRSG